MMKFATIPGECSRCGAPLTQDGEHLFCEYCGKKYILVPLESVTVAAKEQQEDYLLQEVKDELLPDAEQPLAENTAAVQDGSEENQTATSEYPSHWLAQIEVATGVDCNRVEATLIPDNETDASCMAFLFYVAIIIFLSLLITHSDMFEYQYWQKTRETKPALTASVTPQRTLTQAAVKRSTTETAIYEPSLIELIYRDQYDGLVYPADSNEDLLVATSVVLENADANSLIFSLFVYNQSGKDIDTSSLEEHLEIDSLAVTSDRQDEFVCSLQKDNWAQNTFRKAKILRKGIISCSGSLNPDASSIIIDFDMPNWGSPHFLIPIMTDNEDLQSSIELNLAPDSYSVAIELNSETPQLVWVKKSDILISDDRGVTLSVDGCTPTASQQGAGEYFLSLTYPSGYYDRTYDGNLIVCKYDEPFLSEINTMSASLKTTSGKTFTSQAVINKSEGLILFNEQTTN